MHHGKIVRSQTATPWLPGDELARFQVGIKPTGREGLKCWEMIVLLVLVAPASRAIVPCGRSSRHRTPHPRPLQRGEGSYAAMRNLKLTLSYDGTDFNGWQTQPGYRTVQETLEQAIAELTGEARVRVNASGRTDAGVHAVGQVVNFYTRHAPAADEAGRAPSTPTCRTTSSSATAEDVPQAFDANRDAVRKLYRYVIHDGPVPDPFLRRYCLPRAGTGSTPRRWRRAAEPLRGPARLPQLRDRMAQPHVERPDHHAPGGQPRRRLHLDRRGGGRLPVQYGAGHRRHADQRRPRLLARGAGRGRS